MSNEITTPRPGLYLCSRTSMASDEKPCDEAFKITILRVDIRSADDPKKIPANRGTNGDWYERGTNHRLINGMIARDLGTVEQWAVELDRLEDFVLKYGRCVVQVDYLGFMGIEIYDDWRE